MPTCTGMGTLSVARAEFNEITGEMVTYIREQATFKHAMSHMQEYILHVDTVDRPAPDAVEDALNRAESNGFEYLHIYIGD